MVIKKELEQREISEVLNVLFSIFNNSSRCREENISLK